MNKSVEKISKLWRALKSSMNMNITRFSLLSIIKVNIIIIFIFYNVSSFAQEKYSITGRVKIENGSIDNTFITIYRNANKIESKLIDKNGKFSYDLDFGNDYIFEFSKEGFVSKKVSLSTFVPEEVLSRDSQFPPFRFTVSLFPAYEGLDLSVFDQPMGMIMYDKELDDFDHDKEYDAQIRDAIRKAEEAARKRAAELEAQRLAKERSYKAAIQKGDISFREKKYEESKLAYSDALTIKPEEQYPKTQLAKIDELLAEQQRQAEEAARLAAEKKALEEKYASIVSLADSQFESGDYSSAKTIYSDALALKSEEQYPKTQLAKIDELLAEQQRQAEEAARLAAEKKALEEKYASIVSLADSQFESGDYSSAKTSYTDALALKSEEEYPKSQITKIDELLAEQQRQAEEAARLAAEKKALEEKYASIVSLADSQFESGDYSSAKTNYSDALALKSEEQYPKSQLAKIDELLAEQQHQAEEAARLAAEKKALDENYASIVSLADSQFESGDYISAKTSYADALALKSEEQYPKTQLAKIDELLAEQQRQAEEAARLAAEKKALEEKYASIVSLADSQFESGDYSSAKTNYSDALALKSEEQYPKSQLAKIDELLAEQQRQAEEAARLAAEKKALDEKYASIVSLADSQFESGDYSSAKKSYSDALALKSEEQYPKSQLAKIDELLAEQQRQAEEAARLEAEKKALDEKYASIVSLADSQLESGDYSSAKTSYSDALALKPEEQYPKTQLAKIDELLAEHQRQEEEAARLAAEKKALDEKYASIVSLADSQFESGDYSSAKTSYSDALALKSEEQYPKTQLAKIEELLAEQQRQADEAARLAEEQEKLLAQKKLNENKYLKLIQAADEYFESEKWNLAAKNYYGALKLKPEEQYPQSKIDEIEAILAEIERKENEKSAKKRDYEKLIAIADKQFGNEEYDFALLKYQEALDLMPKQSYPKNQIKRIEVIMERQAMASRKEQELNLRYSEELEKAEDLFKKEQFSVARHHYKAALEIKPKENYPKDQLDEIRKRLKALKNAEQEAIATNPTNFEKKLSIIKEKEYADLIQKADQAFQSSQFTVSKVMYERALRMFERDYPKKQLKEIEKLIKEGKISDLSEEYKQLIARGDKELSANQYAVAKFYYKKALRLNGKEKYPKNQLKKIDELLQSKKNQKADKEYKELIARGDAAFNKGNLTVARFYYKKAQQIKPGEDYPQEKLKMIQSKQSKK
ncbi:hypothetical protein [Marinifilum sp.]|uniref:hypothetical protein n=1 Tax=Marinifilum sp. TaxID=2033137 RepID=UPI003BAD0FF6